MVGSPSSKFAAPQSTTRSRVRTIGCVSGMRRFVEPDSVSVIVTSPPYNLGKAYARYDDSRPRERYLAWLRRVSRACRRVLSPEGSFFLNLGNRPSDQLWAFDALEQFRADFRIQNTILWVKSIAIGRGDVGKGSDVGSDLAVGHFKPINSDRYLNGLTEYVFHLTRSGKVPLDKLAVGVPYQDKSNMVRFAGSGADLRDRGNVWFIPYDTIHSGAERSHPCVFPIRLPEMCIQLHGVSRTKLVMDPFLGTGSTALAADRLNLPFVGFDIDLKYTAMAKAAVATQRANRAESERVNGPVESRPWTRVRPSAVANSRRLA
jgi:site-specific DNA-methyltransferase (adenine-specific)